MGKVEDYNRKSSGELGWEPRWFIPGHIQFDELLTNAIIQFQKDSGIAADGMCGPGTYRRIYAKVEADSIYEAQKWMTDTSDVIWWQNTPIKIDWPSSKVHTFKDQGFPYPISEGVTKNKGQREIRSFVNHWDVCLSSSSCAKVLKDRGVSVHFCIDNDGTIIQLHDINDSCWHAGVRNVNRYSIGVEISNAWYPKYQNWYVKNGFGERPIISGAKVNGRKLDDHLGFYQVQLEALKALWKAVHEGCGIPYVTPDMKNSYDPEANGGNFRGFMHHYHCSAKKIDCGGLDIDELMKDLL